MSVTWNDNDNANAQFVEYGLDTTYGKDKKAVNITSRGELGELYSV